MELMFQKYLERINFFLKFIGFYIDSDDSKRSVMKRLQYHWRFVIHILSLNIASIGEFLWLIKGFANGISLTEITYILPCFTLCLLGYYKIYNFIKNIHHANDIIEKLQKLEPNLKQSAKDGISILNTACIVLLSLEVLTSLVFGVAPFYKIVAHYHKTNELKLYLPFFVWYPFNAFDLHIWPLVYFHQMWATWVAVYSLFGPDIFFLTSCAFIHIQFIALSHDWKHFIRKDSETWDLLTPNRFQEEFIALVDRHRELIRCVELLEKMYAKSTLFNVVISSLIICVTGFNLLALNDFALVAPFFSFVVCGTLQIFCYCYYGDCIMRSSSAVGDAIYNSDWFYLDVADRKYFPFVLARAQRPCKVTAYGFTDINLRAFTRILSTSWSYFALLRQINK